MLGFLSHVMVLKNKIKGMIAQGGIAFGGVSHIPSTAIVELMGIAGYDFDLIDTEHGMYDVDTAGELIRAASGVGLTPIVRVLQNDPGLIMKAFDLGAEGVVVPHVVSKDDAERAVRAAKYHPEGERGSCPFIAAAGYSLYDWAVYQEAANRETMVIVLIEDREGVENIDEILSVKGIDAVFLGPFDMSVGMGQRGDALHPDVQGNLDRVITACRMRNVPVMSAVLDAKDVAKWIDKGARLFVHASDTELLARASASFVESASVFRKRLARPNAPSH